jgi:agmatine deiminase
MSAGAGPSDANGASSETERWYLPPEWAPHAATWLSWPHNRDDWPGKMVAVTWAFAEIVRALTTVGEEHVHLIVRDARHEAAARRDLTRAGVDLAKVETFTIPTDRGWCRDCGPMFLRRGRPAGPIAIGDFGFTGWAKYDN